MTDAYSGYSYKRKRKAFSFFKVTVIAAIVVAVFLIANLIFGFISFFGSPKKKNKVIMPAVTVWVIEADAFGNKNLAIGLSRQLNACGGAGYLIYDEDWHVIDSIHKTKEEAEQVWNTLDTDEFPNARIRQFSIEEREVNLADADHEEIFNNLTTSFYQSFISLDEYYKKLESKTLDSFEIAGLVRQRYNELGALLLEFNRIQENVQSFLYAQTILNMNKQLIALFVLSTEGDNAGFKSILKNTMCAVAFAYILDSGT